MIAPGPLVIETPVVLVVKSLVMVMGMGCVLNMPVALAITILLPAPVRLDSVVTPPTLSVLLNVVAPATFSEPVPVVAILPDVFKDVLPPMVPEVMALPVTFPAELMVASFVSAMAAPAAIWVSVIGVKPITGAAAVPVLVMGAVTPTLVTLLLNRVKSAAVNKPACVAVAF